jgi:predicted choloylglycine hydrolase
LFFSGCAVATPRPLRTIAQAPTAPPVVPDEPLPVPVVTLQGSGSTIGETHGRELRVQIQTLESQYLNKRLGDDEARRMLAYAAASMFATKISSSHMQEITGLANTSGLEPRTILLAQCFLDLTNSIACSTIALPASAAPDGVARLGRNLDFPSLNVADKLSVVMIYKPADAYQFVAIGWPGLVGVLSGMNEHGLTLANMEVNRSPRFPSAMPYPLLYRTILEKCRTVDEAIALLESTPRQTANNLMLMDATGKRAVVEIKPEAIAVRHGIENEALISTNHQRDQDSATAGRCRRYDFLRAASAESFGQIDVEKIESMLKTAQQKNFTIQSMVFEPSRRVVYLAFGNNAASTRFYRFDLKRHFTGTQLED